MPKVYLHDNNSKMTYNIDKYIFNQCKGPGNDCVALTTKLEVFSHASHHVPSVCKSSFDLSQ